MGHPLWLRDLGFYTTTKPKSHPKAIAPPRPTRDDARVRSAAKTRLTISIICILALAGCNKPPLQPDHPHLVPGVRMEDVHFHSVALDRDMVYRIILPDPLPANEKLPAVWLLHGAGSTFRDWSNGSNIAELATHGLILVMPDAGNSYYVNSASNKKFRDEDYLIDDVIPDVRRRFPASPDRNQNAIIGISRGGFGAVVIALKHPQLFSFAAGMSSAIDMAERSFRWHAPSASLGIRDTFGSMGSETRKASDPYQLIANLHQPAPYFYLTCGQQESLLEPNQRFAGRLKRFGIPSEFHTAPGGHNWDQWNRQLPGLEASLLQHLRLNQQKAAHA